MGILNLFLTFLKIGTFTFGGGHAMLPLITEEVSSQNWMTMEELINFVAISESSPGPFAINIATFVGLRMAGVLGALMSTIGVILTSFVVILFVARGFEKFKENKLVKACMTGLKPAVVALIGTAVVTTASAVFFAESAVIDIIKTIEFYKALIVFIISLVLALKKVHPIKIIIMSAILGILMGLV